MNYSDRSDQPKPQLSKKRMLISALAIVTVLAVGLTVIPQVRADNYDAQIQQLLHENGDKQNAVNTLQGQAASYQEVVNKLQVEIDAVKTQIAVNAAKQADLQARMNENQVELDKQRSILGENIRVMYVEGQISTIEMLATSKNLSEFVDKEEYHNTVKNKIQETLSRINKLQDQLKEQKVQIEKLLADQQAQQAQLNANQAEQGRLLALNAAEQANYTASIKANQGKISELRRKQAAENARLSGGKVIGGAACDAGNGDTYPQRWCAAPMDSMLDSWGMYNRECVSYTAWKVYESGRNMPYWGGRGNANQWDDNARASGIPVDGKPRAGDVAVKNGGEYGHVMYVEHVYNDGSVLVSDYNQQWDGAYRQYTVSSQKISDNNLVFIHFP